MDVVNGRIVSARTERSSGEGWSGLKPSRGRTVDQSVHGSLDHLRGTEWAPSWTAPWSFGDERALLSGWGGHGGARPPNSLALELGAARWNQRPSAEKPHYGPWHEYSGTMQPRPVVEHRQGWGGGHRHFHFGPKPQPWTETNLDQMMAMYESQITREVPGHMSAASSAGGRETPTLSLPLETSQDCSLQRAGGGTQESEAQSISKSALVRTSSDLKRKRLEITSSEGADQADCGWSHPLKLLLRKALSVSDVGDLGRVIIPKKYAESKFQKMDAKEGTLLEMKDYTGSKRWFFRFKWWINNKSRMYVLENTGEFIKYHNLKKHDIFVVYEDGLRKMVVHGQKRTDFNSTVDVVQVSNTRISQEKLSSTKEKRPTSRIAIA